MSPSIESMIKCRKSRRCCVHSLDSQKPRTSTSWLDVWGLMSNECRKEMAIVENDGLLVTLTEYVQRHKFCSECKTRVFTAYDILIGDEEGTHLKGYSSTLYQHINSTCSSSNHLHLKCDSDFLSSLISRAEPELFGSNRERHANTIDAAQEEVLTCVGLHVFDRFHRLASRLRVDHQTWNLLFFTSLLALKRRLDIVVEQRRGLSHIDLVCAELEEFDKSKSRKQEKKKRRKEKKKKDKLDSENPSTDKLENDCDRVSKMMGSSSDLEPDVDYPLEPSQDGCHFKEENTSKGSRQHTPYGMVVADSDESGRGSSPMSVSTPPTMALTSQNYSDGQTSQFCNRCKNSTSHLGKEESFEKGTLCCSSPKESSKPKMSCNCSGKSKPSLRQTSSLQFYCDNEEDLESDELTEEELRQFDAELLKVQREALRRRIREQFNLRLKQLANEGSPHLLGNR